MVMKERQQEGRQRRYIGALLRVPHRALVTRIYNGLTEAGYTDLRPAYLTVFQNIKPRGSRPTELAESAHMTKQSMGYLIDYLEEHGYVERVPDPQDGRARLVRLTERGRGVDRKAREIVVDLEDEWAELLGPERMNTLIETLMDLTAALGDDPWLPE